MRLTHVENRLQQQLAISDLISTAYDNLVKDGVTNLTSVRIRTRRTVLKENWERFSLFHEAIALSITELINKDQLRVRHHPYFADGIYSMTHECYVESLEQMNALLENDRESTPSISSVQPASSSSTNQTCSHNSRLPRIDLPKFNGTPSDWLSFKDLFGSLILTNPTLSAVEKLQYLKTSLVGSASHILKNTTLTSDNFQKAWEALVSFYENKRLLVDAALQSLLTLKRMTKESATEMENLYNQINEIYRTLETLQRPVDKWDDIFVFVAVQRLDAESVKSWNQLLGPSKEPPTWSQFSNFFISRLLSLKAFEKTRAGKTLTQPPPIVARAHFQGKTKDSNSSKSIACSICSSPHYTSQCSQYTSKSIQQRLAIIAKLKLCYNCLGPHRASSCRVTTRCKKCGNKHHTTIHRTNTKAANSDSESTKHSDSTATNSKPSETHVLHSATEKRHIGSRVFLATAQVIIVNAHGETAKVRALIDQGSEISIISERLVQRLRLPKNKSSVSLIGITAQKSHKTKGITQVTFRSHFDATSEFVVSAHILPKITNPLPSIESPRCQWPQFEGLSLADLTYFTPGPIDLLLGADIYTQIIENGLVKGDANSPIAQRTKLGWIISGPTGSNSNPDTVQGYHLSTDNELYDLLQKFWKLEEISSPTNSSLSDEEQKCEQHFISNYSRDSQGRYIVRLPFKESVEKLGDSKQKALRILSSLSKKLASDQTYANAYTEFLDEYESLQHMRRVSTSEPEPPVAYYLPHHGVLRDSSLTTKLRVVFNGSSRTDSGTSVNDILHTGAKLQIDLFDVLVWFRQFRYVFSTDVEKMYRQIKIHQDDWNFQRILWFDTTESIITYQLTTVTYGLACAPYLALRTLTQLQDDEGARFPLAIPSLRKGRYVDDLFGGADSIHQAQEIVQQLSQLCMAGGFPLQKWSSNHSEILHSISPNKRINLSSVSFEKETIHVLGLRWNPSTDTFHFSTTASSTKITKRSILSTIAKLFDPLGLISPVIITAKILIQELWSIKLDWDDPLPASLSKKWINFVEQLREMPQLSFPRWIGSTSDSSLEIHGFGDASQHAMCATAYLRSTGSDGRIVSHLICSKTKVAPLKRLSIPRLELVAAVMLTRLVSHILKILEISSIPVFMWTDSAVTHTWINNHPSRWKDFVYNRVCYIQETIPHAVWKFLPGTENPADCATRGLTPARLLTYSMWWSGPSWLSQDPSMWPQELLPPSQKENLEERPKQVSVTNTEPLALWDLIHKYSTITRLLRITSWCMRVSARFQCRLDSPLTTPLTTQELERARIYWIKSTQQAFFRQELTTLARGQPLSKSNSLVRLTPYVDSAGLLRIGGRLQHSLLPESSKHPLILPRKSAFTLLIIADAHSRSLHGGTQITLSFIRSEYWIIGGRASVRSFILKCVRCTRYRQKRAQQIMGQLPPERLTPSRPFLHSGVDYAGPFSLRNWRGRNSRTYKAYISLFVCRATSAIHLELVTDYSTEAFIAAYKRFTSRRGICATLTSDCGTNFKGADSELRKLFSSATKESESLAALLATDGTQWNFIPPAAPHFGGIWEAGVKSVKYHMRRAIGDHLLTYEEMSTLLTQIEAVLNSRPLCPLTDDPDDLSVLTPGHFLIGTTPTILPEPSLESVKISHLSRWQLNHQMLESFWSRWSRECLQRYLAMYKWNRTRPAPTEGSLVLVIDERYPPSKWPLGRIIQTHPGKDGHTRVVTVRTQTSILKRPIVKLCPLPITT